MSNSVGAVDPQAIALIISAAVGIIAAVTAGIRKGISDAKKNEPDAGMRLASATIMDNATMMNLTAELRINTEALDRNTEAITRNADKTVENTAEIRVQSRR